jgi:hypothetical protein
MMRFPTEWNNNPNVPNHPPVFNLEFQWTCLDIVGTLPYSNVTMEHPPFSSIIFRARNLRW